MEESNKEIRPEVPVWSKMYRSITWILFAGFLPLTLPASPSYCSKKYCKFVPGDPDTRLILTAPHGGWKRPSSIPERRSGCLVDGMCEYSVGCSPQSRKCRVATVADSYTRHLSMTIAEEYRIRTGSRPHLIMSYLHRSRLDPNREIGQAAFGNAVAEKAYQEFFGFIDEARALVRKSGDGFGLLVDVHGQTHPEGWNELGYLLKPSQLNQGDEAVDTLANMSSIRALANRMMKKTPAVKFSELLRGSKSLGKYLGDEDNEMSIVPSPMHTGPANGKYYYGGHITKNYGSRYSGDIDAIQIEVHRQYRFSKSKRQKFGKNVAAALEKFLLNYQ